MNDKQTALALQDEPMQVSPLGMVQLAVAKGAGIEVIERLMALAERWQANEAKRAYDAAMAEFKSHPPRIAKNKEVSFGNTHYSHATLDEVCDKITAALSKVGISHKWDTEQKDGKITVTCVLTHSAGHSERTPLEAAADTSGSKNAIQAIGSAVTYLQRYTLLAATGLAVAGSDNDGATAGASMPEPEYLEWMDGINQAPNANALKQVFAQAYRAAEGYGDHAAMKNLIAAKDKAKAGLA